MAEPDYAPWEVTELIDAYELRIDEAEAERDAALARLTTAETEREEYASECRVEAQRRRVAEVRVEAAEQERDREGQRANDWAMSAAAIEARYVKAHADGETLRIALRAAEARVEAAERLVTDAVELLQAVSSEDFREYGCACGADGVSCFLHATTIPEFLARAALACPPQQRGE